jgi:hypothetical protein
MTRWILTIALLTLWIGVGAQIQSAGTGKVKTVNNVVPVVGNVTLYQSDITEAIVTPDNRTRVGIWYSDTFRIPKDTILAGCLYHPLIRPYGTDTMVVIRQCIIQYAFKTAGYTCSGLDSIFIRTKYKGLFVKSVHIDDSYLDGTSGGGFFPVAVDKKDIGEVWSLYIPNNYTVGAGALYLIFEYKLVVRKNV